MTPRVIPLTPLYLRYRALQNADQAERLRYARDVLANPAWLAEEFVTTVLRFGEYDTPISTSTTSAMRTSLGDT